MNKEEALAELFNLLGTEYDKTKIRIKAKIKIFYIIEYQGETVLVVDDEDECREIYKLITGEEYRNKLSPEPGIRES